MREFSDLNCVRVRTTAYSERKTVHSVEGIRAGMMIMIATYDIYNTHKYIHKSYININLKFDKEIIFMIQTRINGVFTKFSRANTYKILRLK